MIPAAVTAAMVNVELPCRAKCPSGLAQLLYAKYKFYVPVVSLPAGASDQSTWIRISTGVYTELADFEMVRDAVLAALGAGRIGL